MNPGPLESGTELGRSTVNALRSFPALLGVILLQMITIGILAWTFHERNEYESGVNRAFSEQIIALIKQCGPLQRTDIPLPLPFLKAVPRG